MNPKLAAFLMSMLLVLPMILDVGPAAAKDHKVEFWLTVLHNNDGESQVINAGEGLEDFGGAARFKAVVDKLRWKAVDGPCRHRGAKHGVVMISSGDNFLAGPEFNAGLINGIPYYDTIAMDLIKYDAIGFGNHDFDFGPVVLANFLAGYVSPPRYVTANLDFSTEPGLQAFVEDGMIAPATIIRERGERIGVIGLNTPNLPFISSPRGVIVSDELTAILQSQINKLKRRKVNKIILTSHLQNILNEIELVSTVEGLDVVIAGGGDELLANSDDLLLPGDTANLNLPYPMMAVDKNGRSVPVVTTSGEYRYVGRLILGFDKKGEVIAIDNASGPVRVVTGECSGNLPCNDTVEPDPTMQARVVEPVETFLADLDNTVIATSEVALDGTRDSVRAKESNEGNLITDAQRWQAEQLAPSFGVPVPDVAIQNGGGIRNNTVIPAGDITELDTFDMVPFANFLAVVPEISREQFKEILENAVACTQAEDFNVNPNCGSGRFAQISGFSFQWTPTGTAMVIDLDGNTVIPGTRVQHVELDNGTVIVDGGYIMTGDPVTVAIVDFSAKGGDQYPFRGASFTTIGVTYQQALSNYIQTELNGNISAAAYPEGGMGRTVELP